MHVVSLAPAGRPDFYVLAADGVWSPAYQVTERVIDGVNRTTFYVHHTTAVVAVTPARMNELAHADRVAVHTAHGWEPMIAVVDDAADEAPVEAPRRAPSERQARLRRVDMEVPLRERLRRLLSARATSLHKLTGEMVDDVRHEAVADATNGRTDSSMDRSVTEDEMGDACTYVEDRLYHAGFDFDAEDAAYWERRAEREKLTAQSTRLAA